MKLTKAALVFMLALFVATVAPLSAAPTAGTVPRNDSADVVVLLDLSQSVLPYFQDVTQYVVHSVAKDFLRMGDTFHLLSFGDSTQVEIAQGINGKHDVDSVLGRLYLLLPLERHSDFAGALGYLYQYLTDLPESRQKIVIVISDGINNPPQGAATFGLDANGTKAAIQSTAAKIRANGWPVHFIRLPFAIPAGNGASPNGSVSPAEAKGGESFITAAASALGADISDFTSAGKDDLAMRSLALPLAEFPADMGRRDYTFAFPVKLTNRSAQSIGFELEKVVLDNADVLVSKAFLNLGPGTSGSMEVKIKLPDALPQGKNSLVLSLYFANGIRVTPQSGNLNVELVRNPLAGFFQSTLQVFLFLIIVAAVLVAVFLLLRRLSHRAADAPVVAAVLEARSEAMRSTTKAATQQERRDGSSEAPESKGRTPIGKAKVAPLGTSLTGATINAQGAALPLQKQDDGVLRDRSKVVQAERAEEASRYSAASHEIARNRKDEQMATARLLAEAAEARKRTSAENEKSSQHVKQKPSPAGNPRIGYSQKIVKPGSILIEMLVMGQNSHIGQRNVHQLTAGSSKTIGGRTSDFLVFLLPVPGKIAELHFDGESLTLVPIRSEYFPEIDGMLPNCLGKAVPFISSRGTPLSARFVPYERPEEKANRLLHCIDAPGLGMIK